MVNFVFFCKNSVENVSHFLSDCSSFRGKFESLKSNLSPKITTGNPSDGTEIPHFISSLGRQQKIKLLLGGLPLLFDGVTVTMINRFISSAVGKVHRWRKEMLREHIYMMMMMMMPSKSLLTFKGSNIFWAGQLLAWDLIYLVRESRYQAQLMLRPVLNFASQINRILDSSRPNNCIKAPQHDFKILILAVRLATSLPGWPHFRVTKFPEFSLRFPGHFQTFL